MAVPFEVAVQSCALQGIPESGLNDLTFTSTSTEVAGYDLVKFTLGPEATLSLMSASRNLHIEDQP